MYKIKNKLGRFTILMLVFGLMACSQKEEKVAKVASQSVSESTPTPSKKSFDCNPFTEMAAMDNRTPVPLQPMMAWHQKQNMMGHLVAIQGVTAALAKDDWAGVAKASVSIESSPQMAQMCEHMGSGALGFTEMALDFHKRADKIAIAATAHDQKAVLAATAHTLLACTNCHATYKQDIVSATVLQERTGSEHQPGGMNH